jgi:hypothetical protein
MGAPALSPGIGSSSLRKASSKPLISTEKSSPFLKNATGITAGIHNLKQRLEFLETGNKGLFSLCIRTSECQRLRPARVLCTRVIQICVKDQRLNSIQSATLGTCIELCSAPGPQSIGLVDPSPTCFPCNPAKTVSLPGYVMIWQDNRFEIETAPFSKLTSSLSLKDSMKTWPI